MLAGLTWSVSIEGLGRDIKYVKRNPVDTKHLALLKLELLPNNLDI